MKPDESICPVSALSNIVIEVDEPLPSVYVVRLEGCFDFSNSPQVRNTTSLVLEKEVNRIIVDLSNVSYVDSSGIATLIEAHLGSRRNNIRFTLTGIRPSVEAVLDLANVKELFEIVKRGPSQMNGHLANV